MRLPAVLQHNTSPIPYAAKSKIPVTNIDMQGFYLVCLPCVMLGVRLVSYWCLTQGAFYGFVPH